MDEPVVAVPTVPYRGIQPFRYVDYAIFLAREHETEDLLDLVTIYRGVLLYGASGDGKSSLINAGLLPAAARRRLNPERVRVQPRRGEEIVLERIATTEDDDGEHLPSLLAPDGDDSARIVVSVQAFEDSVREACASHRPLLIFDQFEEIVTLFEEEGVAEAQRNVVEMLVRLLREPLPVKLLFVFREDYLGTVKHLLAAVPELIDQALRLQPLWVDALPTIIRGPFERHPGHFGRELDPDLSERVCAALAQRYGNSGLSLSEVETVALRLWLFDEPRVLLETRGVQGLLEDSLGESLNALSPDHRAAAIALLAHMITAAGTRNVISAEDLVQRVHEEDADLSPPLLSEALERLESESRLVRRERRREIYLYEITSEFLVPWISQRREEARLVEEHRRHELRRCELRRERVRARRLVVLASLAGTLFVVAAVVAIVAVWAVGQRDAAEIRRAAAAVLAEELAGFDPRVFYDYLYPGAGNEIVMTAFRVIAQRGVRVRVGCTDCPPWATTVSGSAEKTISVPTLRGRRLGPGTHIRVLSTNRNIGNVVVLTVRGRMLHRSDTGCRPRGSRVAASKVPARCPASIY